MRLIESPRLYVRYFTPEDLDNFHSLNGDEEIMRYIRAAKTYEENKAFLQEVISWYKNELTNMRLAVHEKDGDRFVGSFAIIPVQQTTELQLGYSFLKEHWGKGYASEITGAGLHYAFDVLGLDSIAGITEKDNIPSQKVLLKNGFVLEREYQEGEKQVLVFRRNKSSDQSSQ